MLKICFKHALFIIKRTLLVFVFILLSFLFLKDYSLAATQEEIINNDILTVDLARGAQGDQVRLLQTWLASDKEIYPKGLITGYFGPLTQQAVEKYQVLNYIVKSGDPFTTGYGRVGPITRASLNSTFNDGLYGIAWEKGKIGNSLFLNGGYLEIANEANLAVANNSALSMEAWIKPSSLTWRKESILSKGSYGESWNFGFGIENKGHIFARHNEGDIVTDKAYLRAGEWQHIAVIYSDNKDYFYYNGQLVETKPDKGFGEQPNDNPIRVGMVYNANTHGLDEAFLGGVDNVKLYKYARKANEIKADFNLSIPEIPSQDSVELFFELKLDESGRSDANVGGSLQTKPEAKLKLATTENLVEQRLLASTTQELNQKEFVKKATSTSTEIQEEVTQQKATTTTEIQEEVTQQATSTETSIEIATTTETTSNEIPPVISSGSGGNADVTAPSAIADLTASASTDSTVTLSWTAPGDDDNSGTASTYDIRYATSAITSDNWGLATAIDNKPDPLEAGQAEGFNVEGLSVGTTYYFAIKTIDEAGNESGLSNVVDITTIDSTAPSAITNLSASASTVSSVTLSWTATGDDGSSGTATSYDVRYSTSVITDSNWNSATKAIGEPMPLSAGSSQSMTISGLTYNTTYYFAIKTSDEMQNKSDLSNIINKNTNAPKECSTSIPSGSQIYFGRTQNMPQIMRIDIDELNVSLGDTQTVSAQIRDTNDNPITSVSGTIFSDNGQANFNLSLTSGTETNGTWTGSWTVSDTLCDNYQMRLTTVSASGQPSATLTFR